MKKNIFTILLLGFVLLLNACADDELATSGLSTEEGDRDDVIEEISYKESDEDFSTTEAPHDATDLHPAELIDTNDRDCRSIDGSQDMHELILTTSLDIVMLEAHIDDYAGVYMNQYGEYVILVAADLDNWQTPEILEDVFFIVCQVENSYTTLNEILDYMEPLFLSGDEAMANVTAYFSATIENIVIVELYEFTDEAIEAFRQNVIDSPLIEFRQGYWAVAE